MRKRKRKRNRVDPERFKVCRCFRDTEDYDCPFFFFLSIYVLGLMFVFLELDGDAVFDSHEQQKQWDRFYEMHHVFFQNKKYLYQVWPQLTRSDGVCVTPEKHLFASFFSLSLFRKVES